MTNQQKIFKGTMLAIFAGILWGISGIFGQLFFQAYHGDALWITSFRLLVAGMILLGISYFKSKTLFFNLIKEKKNWPVLLLYAFGGIFSVQFFYYFTIQLSNSATATILQYTSPVFILIYGAFFNKKLPKLKSTLLVLGAMFGVFLLISNGDVHHLNISILALCTGGLAAVAVVIYSLAPRRILRQYGSVNVAGWGMILAGIGSNFIHPFWKINFKIEALSIFYILSIAILGTAIAFLIWLQATEFVSPLVVNVATATEPLTSVLVSVPLFGLALTPLSIFAMLLVVICVILLSRSEGA
ncbi:EamA family transporter [Lactococcus hircilactis]|uniref:EamA family transporter n=1 Tax=Lactococcus hircilactis TaxID=1494462 RepID=A0A7X1Z8R7_9LACT|nr:DMT family transporter [Lactococcus hircilactis]MQW39898.1 EamA family transporter [Lactococcus hircilactis]